MKRGETGAVREFARQAVKLGAYGVGMAGLLWDVSKVQLAYMYHDLTPHGIWNITGHAVNTIGNKVIYNGPVETPPNLVQEALQVAGGALLVYGVLYGAARLGMAAYNGIRNRRERGA